MFSLEGDPESPVGSPSNPWYGGDPPMDEGEISAALKAERSNHSPTDVEVQKGE